MCIKLKIIIVKLLKKRGGGGLWFAKPIETIFSTPILWFGFAE